MFSKLIGTKKVGEPECLICNDPHFLIERFFSSKFIRLTAFKKSVPTIARFNHRTQIERICIVIIVLYISQVVFTPHCVFGSRICCTIFMPIYYYGGLVVVYLHVYCRVTIEPVMIPRSLPTHLLFVLANVVDFVAPIHPKFKSMS